MGSEREDRATRSLITAFLHAPTIPRAMEAAGLHLNGLSAEEQVRVLSGVLGFYVRLVNVLSLVRGAGAVVARVKQGLWVLGDGVLGEHGRRGSGVSTEGPVTDAEKGGDGRA
ncbi:hypothetical protein [Microbacterium sp. Marseille-Q6965]|uniref:hypothetical protein n=1 Tax=Microbacterium sp. Marseille-Q6965 TaxID=2965072 RepID=UPI0021B714F8|nr:hypothetical protein [Microbacterium sp. Marseille-Q6965]